MAAMIVMTLTIAARTQTETILYSFTGGSDGGYPQAGLVLDGKGNLYGTAASGGSAFSGVVFELSPNSSGTWTQQVLYNFTGESGTKDGAAPYSSLVFDNKGNLYGTTLVGEKPNGGTVFELVPGAKGSWQESVLYSFAGGSDGGILYSEGIVLDAEGNIYGTTNAGGSYGHGTVYELTPGANGIWTHKVLHSFTGGNDGDSPLGTTPVLDKSGNLYGATQLGGLHDYGVIYELTRGTWAEKVLYSFPGGADGESPTGGLVFDNSGNLFGTTKYTVFELIQNSNGTWSEKVLHRFTGDPDGATAYAGPVFDNSGNLYGTTYRGGVHRGLVYELKAGTWADKILHRFSASGGDGSFAEFGSLTVDGAGNVYGMTPFGGAHGFGAVFKITP